MSITSHINLIPCSPYSFGFNGKEKVDEITGVTGTDYDFGARIYDARVGRWLSVDPLQAKYPNLCPYQFAANNPILFIDAGGEKIYIYYINDKGENTYYEYGSKQKVPNNEFVKQTVEALDYVSQSKKGGKEVNIAVNSNEELSISELIDEDEKQLGPNVLLAITVDIDNDGTPDEFKKDENGNYLVPGLLAWSPYTKSEVLNDDGSGTGKTQSSAIMLIHEIKHWNHTIKNFIKHVRKQSTKDKKYETKEERRTIRFERKVCKDLGENIRKNHTGKIHTAKSTKDKEDVTPTRRSTERMGF